MKSVLRYVLFALIALIVILIAAPFFIPADTYKNILISQVKKLTGRDLVIAGDASLTLFPNIALEVNDVSLSNPAGFRDKQLTTIGRLSIDVALMPLFEKRLVMQGATLERAVIGLEERRDGAKSWDVMLKAPAAAAKEVAETKQEAKMTTPDVLLGNIVIKDSTVTYRGPDGKKLALSEINVTINNPSLTAPLTLNGDMRYQGEKVSLKSELGNPEQFLAGKSTPVEFGASLPGATVAFEGNAAQTKEIKASGAVDITVEDLPKLTQWATGKPGDPTPKAIDIKGALDVAGDRYALTNGTYRIDEVNATGDVMAKMGATPNYAAKLAFNDVDIEQLMKSLSGKSRIAGTADLTLDITTRGKDADALQANLNGNGAMKVIDGALLGFDIGKILRNIKSGQFFGDSPSERTDFAELSGTFKVEQGLVQNNDLYMKAPLLRVSGSGAASLPQKSINYRLNPQFTATSKGQGGKDDKPGIAVPLLVTGSFSEPKITPDVAGALKENLKDPEALKENLKGLDETIKKFNSKDDLKRALGF
jgi:uncharacterized protein involved in outer membrane biogenesis